VLEEFGVVVNFIETDNSDTFEKLFGCSFIQIGREKRMENLFEESEKKSKFHISNMDITFDKEIDQETMERLFFGALHSIGVKAHRGCPD
jgi:hypothetical protein